MYIFRYNRAYCTGIAKQAVSQQCVTAVFFVWLEVQKSDLQAPALQTETPNYGYSLLDSSPTVWSFCLQDTLPMGHFAYWTVRHYLDRQNDQTIGELSSKRSVL